MAATDFLNAEILFKTEFTDDQDLEIKDVKHNIIGNSDAHKQLDYRLKYFLRFVLHNLVSFGGIGFITQEITTPPSPPTTPMA